MKLKQIAAVVALLLLPCATSRATITIDTVPVGDVGNPNDPATGNLYGGVSYAYTIGKTEVTVGQYTAFLNAVAATDTYSLYNPSMAIDLHIAGISRTGVSGSYSYGLIGSPSHPVTYVSWGDAARFANWLHNGQPNGAEGPGTTETGAYTLNGAESREDLSAIMRNADATWFIPTESEWYKAAYYQPAAHGGDLDNYWLYPMRTNSLPYSDQPPGATPDNTKVGNFYWDDITANGYNDGYAVTGSTTLSDSQNYLTDAGGYASSTSFYGTFDQGGNVSEWNETLIDASRGDRGGAYSATPFSLQAPTRHADIPYAEFSTIGFRVASASVPEPSTLLLTITEFAALLIRRRKTVPHNRV
jgi:formylglycine-generating enzyme required for sulfatase activity